MATPTEVIELVQLVEKIYEQGELDPFIDLVQTPNRIVLYLSSHHKVQPSKIGADLRMSRPSVTSYLKNLEQDGIIIREMNPDNRREIYVVLTEKGQLIFQAVIGKMMRMFSEWLDLLGPEVEHLFNILRLSSDFNVIGDSFKKYTDEPRDEEADEE